MINTCLSILILTLFISYFKKLSVIKQTVEIRCIFHTVTLLIKYPSEFSGPFLEDINCIKPHNHYHTVCALSGSSSALGVFLSCTRHCFPSFYSTADPNLSEWRGTHEWGITTIVPGWKEAPTHSFQSCLWEYQSWMSHVPQDQTLWLIKCHQMSQETVADKST